MRARDEAVVVAAVAVVAVLHAWLLYTGYVEDDAFIAFRYAARLVDGHGLTWTEGPPVEGYSDLLWVLLTAVGGPHGHLWVARLLGTSGLVAAVVGVGLEPVTLRPSAARALSAGLLLALAGSVPAWAMGGLEHTFLAGWSRSPRTPPFATPPAATRTSRWRSGSSSSCCCASTGS